MTAAEKLKALETLLDTADAKATAAAIHIIGAAALLNGEHVGLTKALESAREAAEEQMFHLVAARRMLALAIAIEGAESAVMQ